jgi:branched-subunit amino acid aminotransferase/4-amino-4-deoxychorismate lyase
MKAYIDDNGKTRLFRPNKNMDRFNNSAARLNLPTFDGPQLLECIKELLRIDEDWIPTEKGYSMYLRPVMFSTTPWLGLTQCRCAATPSARPRARSLTPVTTRHPNGPPSVFAVYPSLSISTSAGVRREREKHNTSRTDGGAAARRRVYAI